MNINKINYNWNGSLTKRKVTNKIIIHHMAGEGSPQDIHKIHLNNGWVGIGYHFFVRLDGKVYEGRPIDTVGAHTVGQNSYSIGVCFEGNYENRNSMPMEQLNAGKELIQYLKKKYPNAKIGKHKDYQATACPGKNFPFDEVISDKVELEDVTKIVDSLADRGIMTNASLWKTKCQPNTNAYWLARKIANLTKNATRSNKLESVNDIVWELNHRGIITNTSLWLKLFEQDKDLYWLGYKAANMTTNK